MEFLRPEAEGRYAALVRAAPDTIIGLDLDGTLSPIVDDPAAARIHPDAGAVLSELAARVAAVAIITGRPARQALSLGDLEAVGAACERVDKTLHLFGQYGNERWSSRDRVVTSPRPPQGLGRFLLGLPSVLRHADAFDAHVEEKGLAVAVHTRRLTDGAAALDRLIVPITDLAQSNGLSVEPGRSVIEVRAPGTHKGSAVHTLARELGTDGFFFAGDDLGDLAAYAAVAELRQQGQSTLLVCSSSDEQQALLDLADIAVHGPDGVVGLLRQFTRDANSAHR